MNRQVAYVVVTYNSSRHIDGLLDSLAGDAVAAGNPIVVVDNGSSDDTVARARRHPVAPRVVENENVGYGGGCNVGAATVEADAYFFLNPDLRLVPGSTQQLLDTLEAEPGIGAIGPATIDPAGTYQAITAGSDPSLVSAAGHFLLLSRLPLIGHSIPTFQLAPTSQSLDVDWVGGAALLVRRQAFEEVGGFDASIFMYMEDVDLCRRLRGAGWRIRYEPSIALAHEMGGSQGASSVDRWYTSFDAYMRRQLGPRRAAAIAVVAAVGLAGRATYYALRGNETQARRLRCAARSAARHTSVAA